MKRILITGKGSYVGQRVQAHLEAFPGEYQVDTLDMVGEDWRTHSFRGYDAVLHVAGIVHRKTGKKDPSQEKLYDRVNHLLAVETASKARQEGVRQFLFMSSESVYGLTAPFGRSVTITESTPLKPEDHYGRSKAAAEQGILALESDAFRVAILRPPMIYGPGCRGNYQLLSAFGRKLPLFPLVQNQRSMIYIENFAQFVHLLLQDHARGVFCPQDGEYISTSRMVFQVAACHGRRIWLVPGMGWALKLLRPFTPAVDKAFGSLCYDRALSAYPRNYQIVSPEEAVRRTEQHHQYQ